MTFFIYLHKPIWYRSYSITHLSWRHEESYIFLIIIFYFLTSSFRQNIVHDAIIKCLIKYSKCYVAAHSNHNAILLQVKTMCVYAISDQEALFPLHHYCLLWTSAEMCCRTTVAQAVRKGTLPDQIMGYTVNCFVDLMPTD